MEKRLNNLKNKNINKVSLELKKIMIDTRKSAEKKSSTKLLDELRYGIR